MRLGNTRGRSEEYAIYLKSQAWQDKRLRAIAHAGSRCERCGEPGNTTSLDVHHLTYERFGKERPADLQVVCRRCHKVADWERETDAKIKRSEKLWEARLNGWVTKVYGDEWYLYYDADEVEEAFDDWLERQDE